MSSSYMLIATSKHSLSFSSSWVSDHIGFKVRRYDTDLRSFIRERATLESLKEVMIKVAAGLL